MVNGINNAGDLNRVFNKYDKNNDGKITRDEVVRTNAECATDTDEITSSDFNQIAPLGDDASSISISELEVAGLKPAIDAKIIAYKQAVDAYKANPTTENQTKVETALRGYNEISGNQPNPAVTAIRQEYEAFERPLSQIRDAWSSADLIAVYQRNKAAIDSQPALRSALEARVKERYQSVSGQDPGNFTSNGLNQILSGEITAQNLPDKIAHIIPVDPRVVIFLSDQLNGQQALSILSNGIYASNPQVSRVLADRIELKDNQRLLVFSHQGITSAVVVETNNLPSTPNTSVSQMLQVRWNVVGGRLPQGVEIHPTSGNGEPVFSGNAILIRRGPQATIPTAIPSAPPTPRLPRGIIITANPTNGVIPIDIKQPLLNREASHSIYHNRIISSGHEIIGAGRILVYSSNQFVVDNNEGRTTGISQNRFDNLSSPMQVYDKAGNPTGEEIPKGASVVMLGTRVLFARINNQIHYYGDQEYYAGPAPSGRNSGRVIFSGTSDTRPNLLTMVRSGAETILGRAIASVRSTIRNNHIETISNKQYLVPNGAVITRDNGAVRSIRLPANSSSTMTFTVQEDSGLKIYTLRAGESLYFNASGQPTHMGSTTATTQFNTAATRAVFAPATREDATIPVRPGPSSLPPGLTFASQLPGTSRGLIDSQNPPPNGTHNVTAQGRILVYNAQNKVAVYNVLPGDKVTIESGKVVSITRGTSTYTFAGNEAVIDTSTPALLQPGQAAQPTVVAQQPPPPAGPTTDSEGVTVYSSKPQGAVLAGLTTGSVIRVAGGQEFAVVNNNGQKELVNVSIIHRRPDSALATRIADGLYYNLNDRKFYQVTTTGRNVALAEYNPTNKTATAPYATAQLPPPPARVTQPAAPVVQPIVVTRTTTRPTRTTAVAPPTTPTTSLPGTVTSTINFGNPWEARTLQVTIDRNNNVVLPTGYSSSQAGYNRFITISHQGQYGPSVDFHITEPLATATPHVPAGMMAVVNSNSQLIGHINPQSGAFTRLASPVLNQGGLLVQGPRQEKTMTARLGNVNYQITVRPTFTGALPENIQSVKLAAPATIAGVNLPAGTVVDFTGSGANQRPTHARVDGPLTVGDVTILASSPSGEIHFTTSTPQKVDSIIPGGNGLICSVNRQSVYVPPGITAVLGSNGRITQFQATERILNADRFNPPSTVSSAGGNSPRSILSGIALAPSGLIPGEAFQVTPQGITLSYNTTARTAWNERIRTSDSSIKQLFRSSGISGQYSLTFRPDGTMTSDPPISNPPRLTPFLTPTREVTMQINIRQRQQ
ncbi:MAG: hypothetical protein KKC80_01295 [Candidatus Margulisbacteria bacterium]|nr:hypothetical protein [Candidatus Margulisiibacteriota bacterium]